jgi:hypothetical protein
MRFSQELLRGNDNVAYFKKAAWRRLHVIARVVLIRPKQSLNVLEIASSRRKRTLLAMTC